MKDFDNWQQLETLVTQMRDLSPLKGLTKLQQLSICLTAVSDLSPMKGLIKKGIEVIWKSGYD